MRLQMSKLSCKRFTSSAVSTVSSSKVRHDSMYGFFNGTLCVLGLYVDSRLGTFELYEQVTDEDVEQDAG